MTTGCSWEGIIRQVRATLLGARHVPERLCGGSVYLGRYNKCSTFCPIGPGGATGVTRFTGPWVIEVSGMLIDKPK